MGELRTLCGDGDQKIIWDSNNEDEVEVAEMSFDRLMEKDYTAYSVNKKGEKGRKIKKFDPDAGKIIMVPPIAGG